MKITMIGKSGSGKTTFMAGLYEALGNNRVAGFFIRPKTHDFKSQVLNLGNFHQLSFDSRNFDFPPGTQQTTLWVFELVHNARVVCEFEWIDYRGGILEDIYDSDLQHNRKLQEQVNELMGHIMTSDSVILFADAILLSQYKELNRRRLHTGARTINQLLRHYATYFPHRPLDIVIALSKADSDAIDQQWKQNNYELLIAAGIEVFHEVVELCRSSGGGWQVAIVPMGSVGEGNVQTTVTKPNDFRQPIGVTTKITDYPTPMNVEHVLFFCLGQLLNRSQMTVAKDVASFEAQRNSAMQQTGLLNEVFARIFGEPNPTDLVRQYDEKLRSERAKLHSLKPHIDPLFAVASQKVRVIP